MGWFGNSKTSVEQSAATKSESDPVSPKQTPVDTTASTPCTVDNVNNIKPAQEPTETLIKPVLLTDTDVTPSRIKQFDAWGRTVLPLEEEDRLSSKLLFTVGSTALVGGLHDFAKPYFYIVSVKKNLPILRRLQIFLSVGLWTSMMMSEWYLPLVQKTDRDGRPYPRTFKDSIIRDWSMMKKHYFEDKEDSASNVTTNANENADSKSEK